MAVDKHGYIIRNLRKVSGETIDSDKGYSQISYDTTTGKLLSAWFVGTKGNTWWVYDDRNIITVAFSNKHMTMQQLADAVRDAMREYQAAIDFEIYVAASMTNK